uniref:MANEC domain-containing protein n=1 Tax=Rhabditophanes sp. KR3021 TaxID=114890 RepID=A0AC35U063_9BILA
MNAASFGFGEDSFCGKLTIHTQKFFQPQFSKIILSRNSSDLKECLDLCCNLETCNAVTFSGVLRPNDPNPNTLTHNCQLISCPQSTCQLTTATESANGVVSILLSRDPSPIVSLISSYYVPDITTTTTTEIPVIPVETSTELITTTPLTTNISDSLPSLNESPTNQSSSSISISPNIFQEKYTPVWAIGLGFIIAFVCIGASFALVGTYICYRRSSRLRHTAEITTIKSPTLHAFNPNI